jgi:signal peptidase I
MPLIPIPDEYIDCGKLQDIPSIPAKESILYLGKSMYPTLHNFDLLYLAPPHIRSIRLGDIIAFRFPDQSIIIVHRVIGILEGGIVTRGDANYAKDSSLVQIKDTLGSVKSIERDGQPHRILTGYCGLFFAYLLRIPLRVRKVPFHILLPLFRNVYYNLSNWGIIGKLLCFRQFTRIGVLNTPRGVQLQLLVGKRTIGWLRPPYRKWAIIPPFHLLVNEAQLPMNIEDIISTAKENATS